MSLEMVTFEDLYTTAIDRVKGDSTDDNTVNFFKEAINTRYKSICSRKKWKFLRVTDRSLQLPVKVTAGTVSISNGSRTVTGVATSFSANHRNWWIKFSGSNNSYRVISVASTTSLTIASPLVESTITGGTYKLYQSELALFPDLEDIDDVRIDGKPWLVEPKGPAEISAMKQRYPDREGAPTRYTIEGKGLYPGVLLSGYILGYDFLGSGMTKAISFFPHIPDADYTVQIPYKRKVNKLENDDDEPLIPIEHRHILLYYVLSDWYMRDRQDQTGKYYEGLAQSELNEMESKFLDTDDVLTFKAPSSNLYTHSYLLRHSRQYFDTEG